MSKPLYIDVGTGQMRGSLNGPVNQRIRFFLRDLLPLRVAFIENGVNVTDAVLDTAQLQPALLKVGIRAKPGQGTVLALATVYTVVASEALLTLNLNTVDLIAYMATVPDSQNDAELVIEVEVTSANASAIVTYYQAACVVAREVNVSDDDPPVPAAEADNYVLVSALAGYAGATVLDELLDVDVPAPSDLNHLIFKTSTGRWISNGVTDGGNF